MVIDGEGKDSEVKTYISEFLPDGLPDKLYKFSSVNANTHQALKDGYLWYSSPSSFNDPYDCYKHLLKFEPTRQDIIDFAIKNTHVQGDALQREIDEYLKFPDAIPLAQASTLGEVLEAQGICCFTTNYQNTLMWSYAKHHSGICMVFEPKNDLDSFFIGKVRYVDEFSPMNYYEQKGIGLMFLLVTKSKYWAYESEYRSIHDSHGAVPFQRKALIEIIFGCKTSQEDIFEIINTIEGCGYKSMKYSQAYMEPNTFKLAFKPLDLL